MYYLKCHDKLVGTEMNLTTGKKSLRLMTTDECNNANTYRNHIAEFKHFWTHNQAERFKAEHNLNNCQVIKASL